MQACSAYVTVNDLSIRKKRGKEIISGKFIGKFPNGKSCASGNVFFVDARELEKVISKDESLDSVMTVMKTTEKLRKGGVFKTEWSSDKVVLHVWDSYKEDHDKINVYVNDVLMFSGVEAKENVKELVIDFSGQQMKIKIEAVNEGSLPPNTANINIIDKGKRHAIQTNLNKGETVEIVLTK